MPIHLYVSAAAPDRLAIEELFAHLQPLCRRHGLVPFHDGQLAPGEPLESAAARLDAADIVLLGLSPAFLASEAHLRQAQAACSAGPPGPRSTSCRWSSPPACGRASTAASSRCPAAGPRSASGPCA